MADKAEIQGPDARMLSYRKSSECTVKCSPTSCDLTLRHKELAVIQPYSGHLVLGKRSRYFEVLF